MMKRTYSTLNIAMRKLRRILIVIIVLVVGVGCVFYITQTLEQENVAPEESEAAAAGSKWGLIANADYGDQKTRAAFFFAGPSNNNESLYTRHPKSSMWEWVNSEDVEKIFSEMAAAGVNVVKLSWWGYGQDLQYSPTKYTEQIHHDVFVKAQAENMLVVPLIEVTPKFRFYEQFPDDTTIMENRIKNVLSTFGDYDNWLHLYNKDGESRKVIWLIETIHAGGVNQQKFAETFDKVADRIHSATGEKIGFVIDPTPLPPYGSYNGPHCYYLKQTRSILAINPFNITSDGATEKERLAKSEEISQKWHDCAVPYMSVMLPGYDDHIVRQPSQIYGDNPLWRSETRRIALQYEQVGVTLDIWNGFTEGYVFTPTVEYDEQNYNLARSIYYQLRPICQNVDYANWNVCPGANEPEDEGDLRPIGCKIPGDLPVKNCDTTQSTTRKQTTQMPEKTTTVSGDEDPVWNCPHGLVQGRSFGIVEIALISNRYGSNCNPYCTLYDSNYDGLIDQEDFNRLKGCYYSSQ